MEEIEDIDEWKEKFKKLQNDLIEMVEDGKSVLIVGATGVGKTTMLKNLEDEGYDRNDVITENLLKEKKDDTVLIDDIYMFEKGKGRLVTTLILKNDIQIVATAINIMRLDDVLKNYFDEIIEIPKRP